MVRGERWAAEARARFKALIRRLRGQTGEKPGSSGKAGAERARLGCGGSADKRREMCPGLDTVGGEPWQLAGSAAGARRVQVTGMMQTSQLADNNRKGTEREEGRKRRAPESRDKNGVLIKIVVFMRRWDGFEDGRLPNRLGRAFWFGAIAEMQ